jgi:hypothetical protein
MLVALNIALLSAMPALAAATKPNAAQRYWRDFKGYWYNTFESQSGVVLFALAVGALAMFIITRGKWKK